ncbi:hypothetical protein [Xanthocytophaga agilis]|uniref:G8 domain-containing protein n=1 Tax=Xanthocytophaga agilis TaxID=3048010 RepID=A0AAE3R8H6_9BACT|nr:hypothetical protein [Xanthocytophaga agilis]MDJ1505190.1 hypothetical protein [Xanthocytophaga agilis]
MYIPILSAVWSVAMSDTSRQTEQKSEQKSQTQCPVHCLYFYILFIGSLLSSFTTQATSYTWNGSVSTDWNTAANWTPAAVPASTDDITISTVSVARYPVLAANTTTNNFTLSGSGVSLNLGSFTLTCNGTTAITAGTISNGNLRVLGGSTSFGSATTYPVINARLTVASLVISNIQNTTFQKPVSMTRTGGYDESANGNNIYQDSVSLSLTGGLRWTLARYYADTFNGPLTLTVNKPGVSYGLVINTSQYNGNLLLNPIRGEIRLSGTLTTNRTLQIGQVGDQYTLTLSNFSSLTQQPIALELPLPTGTTVNGGGALSLENCVFYGDVRAWAYQLAYKGCTFYRRAILQKTTWVVGGAPGTAKVPDWSTSWTPPSSVPTPIPNPVTTGSDGVILNTFYGPVIINGGGTWIGGWSGVNQRSIFYDEVTIINPTNGTFGISYSNTADVFLKKLTLAGSLFTFGNSGAITTFGEGVVLQDGGVYNGLNLQKIIFKGTTARQLTFGSNTQLHLGTGFVSESELTVTAPHLYLDGAKFLKPVTLIKTTAGDNISIGGNVFNDKVLIRNRASSGTIQMATQVQDQTVKSQ